MHPYFLFLFLFDVPSTYTAQAQCRSRPSLVKLNSDIELQQEFASLLLRYLFLQVKKLER
jgi:hypothetical protein